MRVIDQPGSQGRQVGIDFQCQPVGIGGRIAGSSLADRRRQIGQYAADIAAEAGTLDIAPQQVQPQLSLPGERHAPQPGTTQVGRQPQAEVFFSPGPAPHEPVFHAGVLQGVPEGGKVGLALRLLAQGGLRPGAAVDQVMGEQMQRFCLEPREAGVLDHCWLCLQDDLTRTDEIALAELEMQLKIVGGNLQDALQAQAAVFDQLLLARQVRNRGQ